MSSWSGVAGAFVGGLANLFTQGRQEAHDRAMATLNHKYALEQMAQQNAYQVEQWNRENEYNDPSNVKHRYEAAGLSPYAVFGNSAASGAGIAGGLSSAPSGSSTGHSSTLPSAAGVLSSSIAAGVNSSLEARRIEAQNKESEAKSRLDEQKALSEEFNRVHIAPSTARLTAALADLRVSESSIKEVEAQWAPYMATLSSIYQETQISNVQKSIELSQQKIFESKAFQALTEEQQNKVRAEANEIAERTLGYAYERSYKEALTSVQQSLKHNIAMDSALKQAQFGHYDNLKRQIDAEIDLIGSKMSLNEQQIKLWKNQIAQEWTNTAANVAKMTSEEVREWMYGWIPGRKVKSKK